MSLIGLILVILFSGLRLAMRSWDAGEQRAEAVSVMRLVQGLIRRELRQTRTLFYNDEDKGRVLAFQGEPETVHFVAPMLTYLDVGGLFFVRFKTEKGDTDDVLLMEWQPYRPDVEEVAEPENEKLLDAVQELQFDYFGPEQPGDEPQWLDRWESTLRLPLLIRMRLRVNEEDWPELIVPLSQ